jgi:hypothetical protein
MGILPPSSGRFIAVNISRATVPCGCSGRKSTICRQYADWFLSQFQTKQKIWLRWIVNRKACEIGHFSTTVYVLEYSVFMICCATRNIQKHEYTSLWKWLYFDLQPLQNLYVMHISWYVQSEHFCKHVSPWCNCLHYTGSQGYAFFSGNL